MKLLTRFLEEKIEDIKNKSKFYDIFNWTYKKEIKKLIEETFEKHFKINHRLIDSKKTYIDVSFPVIGSVYYIEISLFDRKGNNIFDIDPEGFFDKALFLQIYKKKDKWNIYAFKLYLKEEYRNKGIGKEIVKTVKKVINKLSIIKNIEIEAADQGRCVWSRLKGCEFKSSTDERKLLYKYKNWCEKFNKKFNNPKKPLDYPCEFLNSEYSLTYIWYLVPI